MFPPRQKFDAPAPMCSSPAHKTFAQRSSHCLAHHNYHSCLSSLAYRLHYFPEVLHDLLQHFPWMESLPSHCWWISVHPLLHPCCQHSLYHDFPQLLGLSGQCEIFQCASSAALRSQTLCHRLCRETPPPLWACHSISACESSDLSPSRRPCRCNRCTGRFCLGALIATGNETCIEAKYTTMPCHRSST